MTGALTQSPTFLAEAARPLACGFALAAGMNVVATWKSLAGGRWFRGLLWLTLALVWTYAAWRAGQGSPPELPAWFKAACNAHLGPVALTVGSAMLFAAGYLGRRVLVVPAVAWLILNAALAWLGLSLADANFARIVTRPDNVPIVAMVFLLGAALYTAMRQAVENDRLLARGEQPVESDYADTVLVWPDVVYLELIGALAATAVLVVWSLLIRAPLEGPANPAVTPNPSKAPWYFLGLQELLVYFPPWIAGVALPLLIILGLMAIPYLDANPRGNGYYSLRGRHGAVVLFLFGFLQLWVLLILIGVFFRGPNWSFFGLYEAHDPAKLVAAKNVTLAEMFWNGVLHRELPTVPDDAGRALRLTRLIWRELPGEAVLLAWFVVAPLALRFTLMRRLRAAIGAWRFWIMSFLLFAMLAVPLKMILVWTLHLSYVIHMPELSFYF